MGKPIEIYTVSSLANALGIAKTTRFPSHNLPAPDAIINGNKPAWKIETLQKWNDSRPGSGNWAASRAKRD